MNLLLVGMALSMSMSMAARDPVGAYGNWAAFRDGSPHRCYAIAAPVGRYRNAKPYATIAHWPGERKRGQLHIRLSRMRAANALVTLSIGERRFELQAGDMDAWAPDARTDAAVVSAIRSGRSMSVESVSAAGRPFADTYLLKGAASAIDAAALACVR